MNKIDIGIPVDLGKLISSRLLIQASSGGGKSYAIRKFAESINGLVQVVIIDIEGEFVSLREKFPFALVGKEGEIPLNIRYAETLAHKLLETNLSAIIDMSEMEVHQRRIFAKRFLHALIESPKHLWHPCVVIIDEADFFAPEGKESESTRAVINLSSRGRKRGICAVLATQRIAKLSKDATADILNKIIGLTGQDIDQKRAGNELGFATREDIIGLRKLKPGEFYGFGPAISNEVIKFKVAKTETTHTEYGDYKKAAPSTPDAIKKILGKLANIPEEAEKELTTKEELNTEIKRLKAELRTSKSTSNAPSVKTVPDEKTKQQLIAVKAQLKEEQRLLALWKKLAVTRGITLEKIVKQITELPEIKIEPQAVSQSLPETKTYVSPVKVERKEYAQSSKGTVSGGEKSILIACASYENGLRRDQLIVLTGYKKTSRDIFISRLKQSGYVEQVGEKIVATQAGISALGDNFSPLPKGEELQEYWMNKLGGGEKEILQVLISAYPESISRDELCTQTDYKKTSRDIFISRLSARELLTIPARGEVKASDQLFN